MRAVGAADAVVAEHGVLEADADGGAVDRADDGLVEGEGDLGGLEPSEALGPGAAALALGALLEVEAGAEAAARAGEDDGAGFGLHSRPPEGGVELAAQAVVHRIHSLGAVERDDRDVVGYVEQDVRHDWRLLTAI